ncbi:MAG: DUF3822 family protein [Bacteroidales bacterium]|jgi:hypothetical protein|nr:DUF3822 family protein [Bacteroidales bacterium]
MQSLLLVSDAFDYAQTHERYMLSIRLSPDGLSFCVYNRDTNCVIALFHRDVLSIDADFRLRKLQDVYKDVQLLNAQYSATRLFFCVPDRTTVVPDACFKPELAAIYHNIAFPSVPDSSVLHAYVTWMNSYAIFDLHTPTLNFLQKQHPSAVYGHDLLATFDGALADRPWLKATILRNYVIITALHQSAFYNSFYYETDDDLLYYILGVAKNQELPHTRIVLSGAVNARSGICRLLKRYFVQVEIADCQWVDQFADIRQLPDARFVNLFNSLICE